MNELYWITRFSSIHVLFIVIMVISIVTMAISMIVYLSNYEENSNSEKMYKKGAIYVFKRTSMFLAFGIFGTVFIPNTKEALLIWGVGGTIDYVKSNPVAKKIPDKCIYALDKWVDSLAKDSVENEKNKDKIENDY